jgi:hypothetical protein
MNLEAFLLAIALVESGNNPKAIGAHGERGRYQITATVWRQHTKKPFTLAHTDFAHTVAERHVTWLWKHSRSGIHDSMFWMAMAWKHGLNGATKMYLNPTTVPDDSWAYATRVKYTYIDIMQAAKVKQPKRK